jgi:hypothetical protein
MSPAPAAMEGRSRWVAACTAAIVLVAAASHAEQPASTETTMVAPKEHRRGTEQTFLTFPEWYLVHSPAEYAAYVKEHTPTQFPFLGHIRQFWQSYYAVYEATRTGYPFNGGYHVMIMVIVVSTTVEYALRAAYETLIGRLSALTATHGLTEEDRYGARIAQDYVDFIRVRPWYEYDFMQKLAGLWKETGLWGPDVLRKWERKYALTTEYAVKAAYGWLIGKATKASYDAPLLVTTIVVDRLPQGIETELPELKVLQRLADGKALITVPRYDAFMHYAATLAGRGVGFSEIAGNRSIILLSALVSSDWQPEAGSARVLFTQPIITQPGKKRVALVVSVDSLAASLNTLRERGFQLEHVYDY